MLAPVASLISTLWATPASWLSKTIWNGTSGGTLSSVGSNAMFRAVTSTPVAVADPPGAGLPLGAAEAVGLGAGDADGVADAEPDGATEALASTDGTAVGDGAGAYVQPGVDEAQAATTARTVRRAASSRVGRMG